MKKEMFVGVLAMSLASGAASADYRKDEADCNEQANRVVQSYRSSNTTSQAVRGVTDFVGSLMSGRDPGDAGGAAVRRYGYSVSSDARAQENRRDAAFRQCMRDKQRNSLKQGQ